MGTDYALPFWSHAWMRHARAPLFPIHRHSLKKFNGRTWTATRVRTAVASFPATLPTTPLLPLFVDA
ncbi:hypothetical protein BP6252_12981 [Coleophoma cylindrospora]|uniref:Uncharacterized protein n=1 Tax=Coleophoma cylindrospora TaxID=1849047 RepID=A0A3D8QEN7_9HELO|nr:hypothetical protein BP6252_12981 [Coleophoma cylindrospora]